MWMQILSYCFRQTTREDLLLLNPLSISVMDTTIQLFLNSEKAIQHIRSDPDLLVFILPNMCGVLLAEADILSSAVS